MLLKPFTSPSDRSDLFPDILYLATAGAALLLPVGCCLARGFDADRHAKPLMSLDSTVLRRRTFAPKYYVDRI